MPTDNPRAKAGPIGFVRADDPQGGPLWATHYKNFSPRLALAFSPQGRDGFLGKLFGGPGKTSIRAGAGIFYNSFGMGMMQMLDRNAFGLTSKVTNQSFTVAEAPRFAGISNLSRRRDPASSAGGPGHTQPDRPGMEPGSRLQLAASVQYQSHFLPGPRV